MGRDLERDVVVEKEFGAELTGQRIGWVATTKRGLGDAIDVQMVSTTVGENGARLRHVNIYHEVDGETKSYPAYFGEEEGFKDTIALTILIDPEKPPETQWPNEYRMSLGENDYTALRFAAEAHNNPEELEANRIWLPSYLQIMPTLRELLKDRGMEEYYPLVYFAGNMAVGHNTTRRFNRWSLEETDNQKLYMPDPSMNEVTNKQARIVATLAAELKFQISEDTQMLDNISPFGDIPPDQIADAFRDSRLRVNEAESRVFELSRKLLTYFGVYLRVGDGGENGSRAMALDASEKDERRSFGGVLAYLEKKDIDTPRKVLKDEIKELNGRLNYAADGLQVLQALAKLETEAVED